jgi:hypothetical protein
MQEIKKSQGLDLLQTVANRETPKWNPSHLVGIDLQSYMNNPTPASPLPSNVVFATLTKFKWRPSLSIGL